MNLDWQTCERARLARDIRFDGRFFTAVITTGIFCRPICPAPAPKPENVRYFSSAAAAGEAGFRPCLRCRPEAAPGSPLWLGSEAVVARATALIQEGYLNQQGTTELAATLGMGERHLRRLFQLQLGASPKAVAGMQRLLFAKKLLHETSLSVTDVALAAGFNSLRRFNDAFVKTYGRSPSQLRTQTRSSAQGDSIRLLLPYRPPLAWAEMLTFLRQRAIPGVEQIDATSYARTIQVGQHSGWIQVEPEPGQPALRLHLSFSDPSCYMGIVERVRRLFDLNANYDAIYQNLSADPLLRQRLDETPGLRLPGAWDPFEFVVRAILGQQISVKAATTLAGRIAERYGTPMTCAREGLTRLFPTAQMIADAELEGIGLTRARVVSLRTFAGAIAQGQLKLQVGRELEDFVAQLRQLPGIGDWTAHYIAMRALGEPDAFPAADLGLMKALGLQSAKDISARAEAWRPWRAYAAIHLWHGLKPGG